MFNISTPFSGGTIISSIGSCFTMFDLVTAPVILFPINSPHLWTTLLEAFSLVSNNCFSHFLAKNKNPYPLKHFPVLGSIEIRHISIY